MLGQTRILTDGYKEKKIEDIQVNDVILDGHLNKVTVVHVIKQHLASTELFKFQPHGPIFTADHQFLVDLEKKHVGVVSKDHLNRIQPQMEEFSEMIHEFQNMENLLQFKNGSISSESFEVVPFDKSKLLPT